MNTRPLKVRILISFFAVIAVLSISNALLGFYIIKKDIIDKAQTKVKNDLNLAREVYKEETRKIQDTVRFIALRYYIRDAVLNDEIKTLETELDKVRKEETKSNKAHTSGQTLCASISGNRSLA